MKKIIPLITLAVAVATCVSACSKKDNPSNDNSRPTVTGKITSANGQPIAGARVLIEHATFYAHYVIGATDANGNYKLVIPAEPAGSWTVKAQFTKEAFGKEYRFDLHSDNNDPINGTSSVVRNFTWKLSGQKPGGGVYGAHLDLYQLGTDANMTDVKIQLTPVEPTLIDGSTATVLEKRVEDHAGTFMIRDVPIGKYKVKAMLPGKTLLLRNRHSDAEAAIEKMAIFGKSGYLAETEYNIEFWLEEQ